MEDTWVTLVPLGSTLELLPAVKVPAVASVANPPALREGKGSGTPPVDDVVIEIDSPGFRMRRLGTKDTSGRGASRAATWHKVQPGATRVASGGTTPRGNPEEIPGQAPRR